MSPQRRRFFWGQTLTQALSRAARHHGVPPEQLDYRLRERRHGFVRHRRAVLIEVDPAAPRRVGEPAAPPPPLTVRTSPAAPPASRAPERPRTAAPAPVAPAAREEEPWDLPDAESELAAAEAAKRLLAFAGLDLAVAVAARGDRLELTLAGRDEGALGELGMPLLDALETLLPRAIESLCHRRVRCRVDGAGLRSAREQELRTLARAAAERARRQGEELLEPLPSAERRIVHLELQEEADLGTESLGRGLLKRVRIFVVAPGAAN